MADIPKLQELIARSARGLSVGYYSDAQIESAVRYVFGVDSNLISDGTYFVAEIQGKLAGCGGWSRRRNLYGGDQRPAGSMELLDPTWDAARIRAFFVAPEFARHGVGRKLLETCVAAASEAGFRRLELMATLPGVPFYRKAGFSEGEQLTDTLPDGTRIEFVRMEKAIGMDPAETTQPLTGVHPEDAGIEEGALLSGRYRVVRLLGSGGMGRVYEVVDEVLGIDVALKTLRRAAAGPEAVRALKREVLLARLVTHPNVCRIYDLGQAGDTWFITMELLRGETLAQRLRRSGPLAVTDAIRYARPIIEGLGAAHRAGVVHRDFKPENTMIVGSNGDERVVVTDFGIARSTGAVVDEATISGTPAYMAPEQVRGDPIGPATDIYALGLVLFEMVTGRLPFEGGSPLELATRRLFETPPSAGSLAPDLDVHWERAIARCLRLAPEDRFASVAVVAQALDGHVDEGPGDRLPALPAELNAFFGRASELDALEQQLSNGARLVSLLGPGGMGKTRLAVHYGHRSASRWPGGVWFCDLSDATSRDGVLSAVAGALGLALGRADAVAQIGLAIAGRGECLLILDNLEQVAVDAAPVIVEWMARAPRAKFLVTSRERLRVALERPLSLAQLTEDEAVTLFVERAQRHRPGLSFEGDALAKVSRLVALLDCLPLAIELAAARLRVLSVDQVLARMNERFRLLADGRGRHATMAATLDVSWELLEPWERATWAQLAVFHGGFTLEAAEQVVDLSPWPQAPWVLDVIQSLVDKSIVRVATIEGGAAARRVRFGMYVSLQEYAGARLASPDALPGVTGPAALRAAQECHGRHFATFGTPAALREAEGWASGPWSRFAPELENFVAACRRALAAGLPDVAAANFLAAAIVIDRIGPFSSAIELGAAVLAMPLDNVDRLRVLLQIGRITWRSGRIAESDVHFADAGKLARELGDATAEALALIGQGHLRRETGRVPEAKALHEAALLRAKSAGDSRAQTTALMALGIATGELGDLPCSKRCFEEGLELARSDGNRRMEMVLRLNLGLNAGRLGDDAQELEQYEAVIAIAREFGDRRLLGIALSNLATTRFKIGAHEEALRLRLRALAEVREIGDRRSESEVLGQLGDIHLHLGALMEAQVCFRQGSAIAREIGDPRREADGLTSVGDVLAMQGRMEEARHAFDHAGSLLGAVSDPAVVARYFARRAVFESRRGDREAAQAALGEAEAIAARLAAKQVDEFVERAREAMKGS
jgi:predicted ATPase/tetratricopeptide (TPR) repeat protein/GNAT superfamily N-acetyltransferase